MSSDESQVGAMPPPAGVVPNFENPESIAHRVVIVSVLLLLSLSASSGCTPNITYFGLLDGMTTLALGFSIYVGYQTTNCLGVHIWDCPASKFAALMKIGDIAGPIFFNLATMFTKISLGLFYLRISPSKTSFRLAVYTVMSVSTINSTLAAFGFAWCINLNRYFLATACINATTDLVFLILPIFILRKLQLPLQRKIGAALLLMTGSFVFVVSLIRVEKVVQSMKIVPTDGTWGMVVNFIWLLLEMWLGIIYTCLPFLYTFIRTRINSKHTSGRHGTFIAVRDPNSGQMVGNAPDDSGYYTGNSTAVGLEPLDLESHDQRGSHEHSIRPAASNKSLLVTTERCDD